MRPIDKGKSPYSNISCYSEAKPFLCRTIGEYCCYCEFPISHVPEIDHVVSKSKAGGLTDWNNLLLSCKYCNTRKGDAVDKKNVDDYMWPDEYNTGIAFSYKEPRPCINKKELEQMDPSGDAARKAEKIFNLVKLGEVPDGKQQDAREKYKRYWKREETRVHAKDCLTLLKDSIKDGRPISENVKKVIVDSAVADGFFSVWMSVFQDFPEILKEFISSFTGTNSRFYDENGRVKMLLK